MVRANIDVKSVREFSPEEFVQDDVFTVLGKMQAKHAGTEHLQDPGKFHIDKIIKQTMGRPRILPPNPP